MKNLLRLLKKFPDEHPALATAFSGIGSVYKDMGDYITALSYYEKYLVIIQSHASKVWKEKEK
jgi:tetratricopeptide (TPR) repeat protein